MKTIHKPNEKFNKEIEIMEKNQTEILELKNSMNEIKNAIENIYSRTDQTEDRITEYRYFEITQSKESNNKKKNEKIAKKAYMIYGKLSNIQILE